MKNREPNYIPVLMLAALLVGLLALNAADAQTGKKAKPKQKSAKSVSVKQGRSLVDILSAARADSIHVVEQLRADSLRLAQQHEAERRRADSLKTFTMRRIEQKAFGVGERLIFDVNYGFLTAGEATMSVSRIDTIAARPCYHVEFLVNSLPSFSWIYKVEDRYATFIDVEGIVPWKFEQHIREGGYHRDFVAEFDQFRHVAKTSEGEYPIPPFVHDIMSAFYYARTMDYIQSKRGDIYTLFNF